MGGLRRVVAAVCATSARAARGTLERYTAARTCCGADVTRVLLVGDGDLSCSAAVAQAAPHLETVATTLESEESLGALYGAEAVDRARRLGAMYGVDATAPEAVSRGVFERVVFNFPHAPGKQNIRRNRELLHASLCALERSVLAPGGELVVALDGGQAGTSHDLAGGDDDGGGDDALVQRFRASWQLDVAAADASLLVAESLPFEPFYETRSHAKLRRFNPRRAVASFLARDSELGRAADGVPSVYTFEVQLFDVASEKIIADALAAADADGVVANVRHVDAYTHRDGRTSHAFRVTLGSRRRALTREAADAVRVAVEARAAADFELRSSKAGRRVSAPRPWPRDVPRS